MTVWNFLGLFGLLFASNTMHGAFGVLTGMKLLGRKNIQRAITWVGIVCVLCDITIFVYVGRLLT